MFPETGIAKPARHCTNPIALAGGWFNGFKKQLNHLTIQPFNFFLLLLFFISCDPPNVPKPRGYFRIDVPEKNYSDFVPPSCPFRFQIPEYATVVYDTNDLAEPCWMYLRFPKFNAEVFLSYKPVNNNLGRLVEDARTMVYKHTVKADAINERRITTSHRAYGVYYEIGGNAASSIQFFVTDSIQHYLRGALYFNAQPNKDSLAPVVAFLKDDVVQLINTLQWKSY